MTDYQKTELLKKLANEALQHRAYRIEMRRQRLQRSKEQLEQLLREHDDATTAINELPRAY